MLYKWELSSHPYVFYLNTHTPPVPETLGVCPHWFLDQLHNRLRIPVLLCSFRFCWNWFLKYQVYHQFPHPSSEYSNWCCTVSLKAKVSQTWFEKIKFFFVTKYWKNLSYLKKIRGKRNQIIWMLCLWAEQKSCSCLYLYILNRFFICLPIGYLPMGTFWAIAIDSLTSFTSRIS